MERDLICIFAGVALGEAIAYVMGSYFWIAAVIAMTAFFIVIKHSFSRDYRRILMIVFIACIAGCLRMGFENIAFSKAVPTDSIRVESVSLKNGRYTITGNRMMVYFTPEDGDEPDIRIGNKIRVIGKTERMESSRNPGEFDFALHYKSQGILFRCFADDIRIEDRRVSPVLQKTADLRKMLSDRLETVFANGNEDDASFFRAALLGDKSTMSDDLYDLYKDSGIAHLLAISGLHVSIMGMGLYSLLRGLGMGYGTAGIVSGILLIFFDILTGGSVSTTRAVIMLIISFLAKFLGRKYDMLSAAGFAGTIIILFRPFYLFSSGFVLSFSAILSIGGPADRILRLTGLRGDIKKDTYIKRVINDVASAFIVSGIVQIFTIPATAYYFFRIPIFGFLLNLIVIPLMTYVLWSGLSAILLSFISVRAAAFCAGGGHYILFIYKKLCEFVSALPCYSILLGRPSLWRIFVYYCFLFVCLYSIPLRSPKLK